MTSFGSLQPCYPKFCLVKKGKCLSLAFLYSVNFINILVILVLKSLSIYILSACRQAYATIQYKKKTTETIPVSPTCDIFGVAF